jgi:DivIVA domain-containing protein
MAPKAIISWESWVPSKSRKTRCFFPFSIWANFFIEQLNPYVLIIYYIIYPVMLEKKLTKQQILQKRFKADVKGYDALEVDRFLDEICEDYERVEAFLMTTLPELLSFKEQIIKLKERFHQLELDYADVKEKASVIDKNKTVEINQDNFNLYRRIGLLEKELYKLGVDPNKIK